MVNLKPAIINALQLKELSEKNIHADVLRLDKIHDVISGNKWFKLKYYLEDALKSNCKTILTFGGAYSNHIIATACAAKMNGLKSIGFIRGEQPAELSHTLLQAKTYDMQLEFVSREIYKRKNEEDFINELKKKYNSIYIIPAGGEGTLGVKGSGEILDCLEKNDYTHILCAVGTGTMFAGIVNKSLPHQKITGICVLKGMKSITEEISQYIFDQNKISDCEINHDYHFGGYAKKNDTLIKFMNNFFAQTKIPSDFVYTGKLFYAMNDLVQKNHFSSGSKLLIIHSGGLQGNLSLPSGIISF
jgi:1-aminocyclopropane-1-carboxylate deaminase/D-cysteine desulfhydrase-like pyridoxal-dependent ACC family enzyme